MSVQKYIITVPSTKAATLVSEFFHLKEGENNQIVLRYQKTSRNGQVQKWEIEGNLNDKDVKTLLRKTEDASVLLKAQMPCHFEKINIRPSFLGIIKNKIIRAKRRN